MTQKYVPVLTVALVLTVLGLSAQDQQEQTVIKGNPKKFILIKEGSDSTSLNRKTLSGIHLTTQKNGSYILDFEQELEENAVLEIKNKAGKAVYQKPVSIEGDKTSWRYSLGKLKPGIYLVEIKTSNTTYWTRFKVRK
ncbi:hypothetical protein C1N53_03435 [Pontibacter sp. SGAir0037]|nr:hypothetical protein C1N53_03435 [Pontibacter sp. SGAir0037]